jgi:class 3 adenylate cyclase
VAVCTSCGRESAEEFAFCPHCEAAFAPPQAAREQRKVVTVLFCDVTGSTDLGEQLDPEALRSLLARYFERMKAIVERHGGSVEKFIGDAVMAIFGVPVVHEDDALRGLRASVEMRDAFRPARSRARRGRCPRTSWSPCTGRTGSTAAWMPRWWVGSASSVS